MLVYVVNGIPMWFHGYWAYARVRQPYFNFCEILCKKINGVKNAIPILQDNYVIRHVSKCSQPFLHMISWLLSMCEDFDKVYFYLQSILSNHQMVNSTAITIPPIPIIYVASKDTMLYPLVALCDKGRSTRYGMTWMQFNVSPETWQNMIILKLKGIKEHAKVVW